MSPYRTLFCVFILALASASTHAYLRHTRTRLNQIFRRGPVTRFGTRVASAREPLEGYNDNKSKKGGFGDLRFGQITSTLFVLGDALSKGSLKREEVKTNDIIIAGNEIPDYNLYRYQSYVLTRVYYQGMNVKENKIVRLDVDDLNAEVPEIAAELGGGKWQKYMSLYSPKYHKCCGPVIVTEEEMRIVSLAEEVKSSTVLALPGLFWLWVAYKFWLYGQ
ncbi:hypothetical protein TrLO_g14087 [Triparma laevis f. longispina]|uniref:Uncharacterized protein n=1 Tax=Triparma laevis f. longispina TaxID=1714387 RepID=A0A9W7C4U8_9STRA|nr:hypothetical protein TrLO_g14087 [Triparma laevis f. longispina]